MEEIIKNFHADAVESFRNCKKLAERAIEQISDAEFFATIDEESNSVAIVVKHIAGNLVSRWTDFLTTDGEKPDRNRDAEFEQRDVISRTELLALLRTTLSDVQTTLQSVDPSTLPEFRKIQGNDVDILEAVFHVTEHFSMHAGQIFLLTKLLTATDLNFYDFEAEVPVERWHSGPSGSS